MNIFIEFNIGEGVEPSQCNDLFELIHSGYITKQLYYEYDMFAMLPDINITIFIKKGITKSGDNYYTLELLLPTKDETNHMQWNIFYNFRIDLIISLYEKDILGKYVIVSDILGDFSNLKFKLPIGIKTIPFDVQTVSWVFSAICYKLNKLNKLSVFDKLFENLSFEQFEFIKPLIYESIMCDPQGTIVYPAYIFTNECRARFIHWCNKFAMDNNKDNDISL